MEIRTLYRKYGSPKTAIDFLKARILAEDIVTSKGGWSNLTIVEKDHLMYFHGLDKSLTITDNNTNKISHLMMHWSLTQDEAIAKLKQFYSDFHVKERESCRKRAESSDLTNVMSTYLQPVDMADFIQTSKDLYDKFRLEGIIGSAYNREPVGDGLMDFIESTNGLVNMGLAEQGYTLKTGTMVDFISDLKDIIVNGNYTR